MVIKKSDGVALPSPMIPEPGRYLPNPRTNYQCVYCNELVRLADADAVIDSYKNVIHLACFDKEVSYLLKVTS